MQISPLKKRTLSDDAKATLRGLILAGSFGEEQKLPAEEELSRQLAVSRITIRRALSDLEQEGLILRIHGRGTFVNPAARNVKVNLALMMEFGTVIERNGYHSEYRLTRLCDEKANESLAELLQIPKGRRLIRVEKLHYADGRPVIASIGRIPAEIFKQEPTEQNWDTQPNFDVLQQYAGRIVVRDWVELQSTSRRSAEKQMAASAELEAETLLQMNAVGYDSGNVPLIHGIAYYDTGRIQVSLLRSADG